MSNFADHYSGHAADYARYRPSYPSALFDFVVAHVEQRELAWDCATGNGQAAVALAEHFKSVIAIDGSEQQLQHALPHARVTYRQSTVEKSGLDDDSVDLVTAASAAHWFDLDAFFPEVRRVTRDGALIALWTYLPNIRVNDEIDRLVDELTHKTVAAHWSPKVSGYLQEGYAIPFPFDELDAPEFHCSVQWDARALCDYLRTWSAVQSFFRETKVDPVDQLAPSIDAAWGASKVREVRMPLHLRVGRV